MSSVQVVRIPSNTLAILTGANTDMPIIAYAGIEGGKVIAVGGLAHHRGGPGAEEERWWLFLEVYEGKPHPAYVVRWGRLMLKKAVQLDLGAVYAGMSDTAPMAGKLLSTLGFTRKGPEELTGGVRDVWVWGSNNG